MDVGQVAGHFLHRPVAQVGVLAQHPVDDRGQPHRHLGVDGQHRLRVVGDDLVQHCVEGLPLERLLEGQELVEDRARREHVAAPVDALAHRLLGGHVVRGTEDDAPAGDSGAGGDAGEAEVEDLGPSIGPDQDVGGLDVAMDDAARMRVGEAGADLEEDPHPVGEGDGGPLLDERAQVVPLQQLHRHVELAGGLPLEALVQLLLAPQVRGKHLEGHHAPQAGVAGAVHDAHGALAELVEDLVAAEGGHRRSSYAV